jgi:hypothetical protein
VGNTDDECELEWKPEPGDDQMRRPLFIALASLFAVALVAPTAQADTHDYYFQVYPGYGGVRLSLTLRYKNNERHGRFTPRQAHYDATVSALSCNPPVAQAYVYIFGAIGTPWIKLRKGRFTYTYSSEIRIGYGPTVGNIVGTTTGKLLKKKPGVRKQMRVDGSVSILDYNHTGYGFYNCTSAGPIPYSATPCRLTGRNGPYIKKSLPLCLPP